MACAAADSSPVAYTGPNPPATTSSGRLLHDVCEHETVAASIEVVVVEILLAAGLDAFPSDLTRAGLVPGIARCARREKSIGEDQEVGIDAVHAADGSALLRVESQRCEHRLQVLFQRCIAQRHVRSGYRRRARLRCRCCELPFLLFIALAYLVELGRRQRKVEFVFAVLPVRNTAGGATGVGLQRARPVA